MGMTGVMFTTNRRGGMSTLQAKSGLQSRVLTGFLARTDSNNRMSGKVSVMSKLSTCANFNGSRTQGTLWFYLAQLGKLLANYSFLFVNSTFERYFYI